MSPARLSRRGVGIPVLAVVAALVVVAGWLGARGLSARRHLLAAQSDLTAARSDLTSRQLDAADAAIAAAGRETSAATAATDDPVWWAASRVPLLGRSLRTVRGLAQAADAVARDLLPPLAQVARRVDPHQLRRADGSVDLALLASLGPPLDRAAARAARIDAAARALPSSLLPGPVRSARQRFTGQLDDLAAALKGGSDGVALAPTLLGADRPRTYFVMVQQTSESRGTGGLVGGYAILTASAGRLHITQQGNDQPLGAGAEALPAGLPPGFLERYSARGGFSDWRNVNLSPDLPSVARLVQARWQAQGGGPLDGVISLDAIALADILAGTGPVDTGSGLIPPEQLPSYLGADQYRAFTEGADQARKASLTNVAQAAAHRLTGGGGDTTALLRGLSNALGSGHLHMAGLDPELEAGLARAGVDGALPAGPAPLAYPVLFNTTGGKLDYYLHRSVTYTAGSCNGRSRESTVTVRLSSSAPASGLPPYVTIRVVDGAVVQSYVDQVDLSVFTTRGSQLDSATVDGRELSPVFGRSDPLLHLSTEAGVPVSEVVLDVAPGQTRVFTLHLTEPTAPGAARVPEQPLATPLAASVHVPACR